MPISSSRAKLTVVVLCFAGLGAALTQTMVVPLQQDLPMLLDTSVSSASWVVTITLLAGGVSMPVAGRLADMFGKQRVLGANAALLAIGSAMCALSTQLELILAGRALQGLAMGIIPVAISLVREVVPPRMAAGATAAVSATMGVGGAIGLPLAAWIAEKGDWHVLFWVATGVAVAVLLLTILVVPHVHDAHSGSLDVIGILGLALGLVSLLVGLTEANEWGWGDGRTIGAILGGILILVVWGIFELFGAVDPLVDLRTAARPAVLLTNLAALSVGFGMMAQMIVVPRLLQSPEEIPYGMGQSILEAGLWMAPGGLMMMIFAPISARLIGTIGAKATLMVGGAVLGGGYLVVYFMMDSPVELLIASCVVTAGVGIGYAAMPTLILNNVPASEAGAAVGLNSLMRSVGTTLASAVMITLLSGDTLDPAGLVPSEDAFKYCFLAGTLAAFIGVLLTGLIPRVAKAVKSSIEPVPVAGDRPVLVVVGASPESPQVVDRAAEIAADYSARIQVVHVRETEPVEDLAIDPETEINARASLRAHLERLAGAGFAADGMVLHVTDDSLTAGKALAAYAESVDARAVAFGMSTRGSFFKPANGVLSAAFTQASDRSVLLVSAEDSRTEFGRSARNGQPDRV